MLQKPACYGRLSGNPLDPVCGDSRVADVQSSLDRLSQCEYGDESGRTGKLPCTVANMKKLYCDLSSGSCEKFECGLADSYELYDNTRRGRAQCRDACTGSGSWGGSREIPGTAGWFDDPTNSGVPNELGNPYRFAPQ
jgi:hypothetical protein